MSSQCPKKSQADSSRDTIMVGSVRSYFDVGSVSEVTLEPRGADEKICSMDAPNVREGESVDIELDLGAEVSCFPASIGADTHPLHETRLSMCSKLHVLGARILGWKAANVRSDVVNLLVRFRVMNIGKAVLSTQDLSRCGCETVFPADCGNAYLVRKASDTRITLVMKRCAWYLRDKLKPHNELPYTASQEFLEVVSMDQRAGVWLVEEGEGSGSSGQAVPEDVEESELCEKACGADSSNSNRPRRAHGQWACSVQNLVSRVLHRTWPNASASCQWKRDRYAIDYGYLNERDDLLQEAAGAPIWVSECNRDRWIGAAIVPTKGTDEYAVAELKNDVMCSCFTEVLIRSDNEPAILALKEAAATALCVSRLGERKATDWQKAL